MRIQWKTWTLPCGPYVVQGDKLIGAGFKDGAGSANGFRSFNGAAFIGGWVSACLPFYGLSLLALCCFTNVCGLSFGI